MDEKKKHGYYVVLISIHGLIRGENLELGKDPDTGGQTTYVVELARALAQHPDVEQVDLFTRLVQDKRVCEDYAKPMEQLSEKARIIRLPFGPARYLKKESLWPYLEIFTDQMVKFLRNHGRIPDVIHGHYADAGYIASSLGSLLDVPIVFTGHSLGRIKRKRFLEEGMDYSTIENRYHLGRRIEAEEATLECASFVVASTSQEVEEQYASYDNYQPKRMMVFPPGTDLERFKPPHRRSMGVGNSAIFQEISRFLNNPKKPIILAISRPDHRKNITGLLEAYGENKDLQEQANLVLYIGVRDNIQEMDRGSRKVYKAILYLIDKYDLYGKVAYPRKHAAEDVPGIYRLAVQSRGVFVNPALTEPFGLTLIEAAASGLPMVATNDGGPNDIIKNCKNGFLFNPLDSKELGEKILEILSDKKQWKKFSRSGLSGANRFYRWEKHVQNYTKALKRVIGHRERSIPKLRSSLKVFERLIICDIDNTLTGDAKALQELLALINSAGERVCFGVATGRSLTLTLDVLKKWKIPMPDILITSVGTSIHYGQKLVADYGWQQRINHRWKPEAIRELMAEFPGVELQSPEGQDTYKISYNVAPDNAPKIREIIRKLRQEGLCVKVVFSHNRFLDILPIRACKGQALRYFALKWGVPFERCLVAGDSGNDEELLIGSTLGVVVGNHSKELNKLQGRPNIYFANGHHARGIIEGIEHYGFLSDLLKQED